jgi:arylformamidase
MYIQLGRRGHRYEVDLAQPIDCSTTFGNAKREPRAWNSAPVIIEPVKVADWTGAVKAGAPVNFFSVQLNPHGNGTHTECFGHISPEQHKVNDYFKDYHGFCAFFRLTSREVEGDKVVFLEDFLKKNLQLANFVAIQVDADPFPQDYSGKNAAYFQEELLSYLAEKGVKHFITNLPSVDREEDGGALAAHHAFWKYPLDTREEASITELAVFPKGLREGEYFINLQVAPLHSDASPSRPLLYRLEKL